MLRVDPCGKSTGEKGLNSMVCRLALLNPLLPPQTLSNCPELTSSVLFLYTSAFKSNLVPTSSLFLSPTQILAGESSVSCPTALYNCAIESLFSGETQSYPPANNTLPSSNDVNAPKHCGSCKLPCIVHEPVVGSYVSLVPLECLPTAIIVPSARGTNLSPPGKYLAVFKEPVKVHIPVFRSYISAVVGEPEAPRPPAP